MHIVAYLLEITKECSVYFPILYSKYDQRHFKESSSLMEESDPSREARIDPSIWWDSMSVNPRCEDLCLPLEALAVKMVVPI